MSTDDDILIEAKNVSKKFCRNLKQGMLYGVKDIAGELIGKPRNLTLRKNEFLSTDNVSFEVRRGEVVGLIGHNGAGKTTLLKMINGLFPPDAGQLTVKGRVGALIALGAGFNPILSGRENVFVNAAVLGIPRRVVLERFDDIVAFAELEQFIDAPVQSYSSGMQARLGFAVASFLEPDVLLVDEILSVGDIAFRARCFKRMGEIKENGTGIIFVTHNMHQVSQFCNRALHLSAGKINVDGKVEKALSSFYEEQDRVAVSLEKKVQKDLAKEEGLNLSAISLKLTDGDSNDKLFGAGEKITLRFNYKKFISENNFIFDLVIRDCDGVLYQGDSKVWGSNFKLRQDCGVCEISIYGINNHGHTLNFSLAIWDLQKTKLYSWYRDMEIKLNKIPSLGGRSNLKIKLEVD